MYTHFMYTQYVYINSARDATRFAGRPSPTTGSECSSITRSPHDLAQELQGEFGRTRAVAGRRPGSAARPLNHTAHRPRGFDPGGRRLDSTLSSFDNASEKKKETDMGEILRTPIPYTEIPILLPVVLLAIWLFLRNRATELSPSSGLDGVVGQGQPVVLEFFRNT